MSRQTHRTCVRMSEKEYQRLKRRSGAARLSANAWLMEELARNCPILYRVEQTREVIRFMDAAGRDINAIARNFNSGDGTAEELRFAVERLAQVVERFCALRREGYPRAV